MNDINQVPPTQNQGPEPQSNSLPDATVLLGAAWERYKHYWKKYILLLLPLFAASIVLGILTVSISRSNAGAFSPLMLVFSIGVAIVGIIAEAAIIYSVVTEGREVSITEAYRKGASLFWSFLLVQIITGLIVGLGFIALVIPGIYLAVRYSFSAFVLVDEGKKGMEALSRSRDLVKGRWFEVFIRFVFVIVLSLIPFAIFFVIDSSSTFGQILQNLLSLILAPLWILYVYNVYKALKGSVSKQTAEQRIT